MANGVQSNEELLRAYRLTGDQQAFGELYKRLYGLRFVARRIVGPDPGELEDVFQTSILLFWKYLAKFDGRCTVKTWFSRILINSATSFYRNRRLWHERQLLSHQEEAVLEDDLLEAAEVTVAVRCALSRLALPLQEALWLWYYKGISYEQIAQLEGVPIGTIRSRLNRAKKKLSEELKRVA